MVFSLTVMQEAVFCGVTSDYAASVSQNRDTINIVNLASKIVTNSKKLTIYILHLLT